MIESSFLPTEHSALSSFPAEIRICPTHQNQRIDYVLAQLYPNYSRSRFAQWIKSGAITLNHQLCKPKDKVLLDDKIQISIEFPSLESSPASNAQAIPLDILYEDEFLLIVNKPAGLVVHPGAGNSQNTLMNALLHHTPHSQHLPRAGIVHRLDKDTTGLLVVAKTLETHLALVKQMQAHAIQRRYLALVHGHLIAGGKIQTFYGRHPKNRLKMAVRHEGREAITCYTIQKKYIQLTLLDINLITGRTHQIRVHMAYKKHPLVGDTLYGGRKHFPAKANDTLKAALNDFKRQALHAYQLSFIHPVTHKELLIKAPLPPDFDQLIQILDQE